MLSKSDIYNEIKTLTERLTYFEKHKDPMFGYDTEYFFIKGQISAYTKVLGE